MDGRGCGCVRCQGEASRMDRTPIPDDWHPLIPAIASKPLVTQTSVVGRIGMAWAFDNSRFLSTFVCIRVLRRQEENRHSLWRKSKRSRSNMRQSPSTCRTSLSRGNRRCSAMRPSSALCGVCSTRHAMPSCGSFRRLPRSPLCGVVRLCRLTVGTRPQ